MHRYLLAIGLTVAAAAGGGAIVMTSGDGQPAATPATGWPQPYLPSFQQPAAVPSGIIVTPNDHQPENYP